MHACVCRRLWAARTPNSERQLWAGGAGVLCHSRALAGRTQAAARQARPRIWPLRAPCVRAPVARQSNVCLANNSIRTLAGRLLFPSGRAPHRAQATRARPPHSRLAPADYNDNRRPTVARFPLNNERRPEVVISSRHGPNERRAHICANEPPAGRPTVYGPPFTGHTGQRAWRPPGNNNIRLLNEILRDD